MFLPVLSILYASPVHGASQLPDSEPTTLKSRNLVISTNAPVPKLPEDTTIGNNGGNDYIVGGMESSKYTLGYQAYFEVCDNPNPPHQCTSCGGTVVHQRYVITAAHCLYMDNNKMRPDKTPFKVTVGEHDICDGVNEGGHELVASEVFEHPNYTHTPQSPSHSDIAILKLQEAIIFNDHVWPACLPTSPDKDYSGESVTVSGWGGAQAWNGDGQEAPEQQMQCELKVTTLKVQAYSDIECRNQLRPNDSSRLCAYAPQTSTCQGDSGGPLALKRGNSSLLLGVTSYGTGCADTRGVAAVYTRVQGFLPWIAQYVPEDLQLKKSCEGVQ